MQHTTMDVLNDMKQLITKISDATFVSGNHKSQAMDPSNNLATSDPALDVERRTPSLYPTPVTSIPQNSSRSPESTIDYTATDIVNTPQLPSSSEKRKVPSPQEEPDQDEDFSNGGFSDDLDFMTQPPSKATRSHKIVTQKKPTIPKKYLKTKGPLHWLCPSCGSTFGR
ncbi:hypothetical protein KC19_VG059600 [Ceratodon purpureus]|uniref:Uncharacterized protein n=1 Tax=Ceratodon purpureus TaxID=3225 RepID=A0A8T0HM86_CERPU|nr:hypothetical protein KC19_VG059600 [Ceratodon purpureus]